MRKKIFIVGLLLVLSSNVMAQAAGSLDQSANNAQGQYQPMDMGYAGFNSLGMTQAAWLDPLQNLGEGQTKPAYSKYYWHKDLVLPIRLRESMITIINFPEWEMIESVQFGDVKSFSGDIAGPNTVMLWTKGNIGVDTNVIMFGRSGNKYVFYLKSEGVDTERLTNAIIDIEIPDEVADGSSGGSGGGSSSGFFNSSSGGTKRATRSMQKNNWLNEIPFSPENLRFDMEVYVPNPDDVVMAPERVWRDDIFTYIDLGEKSLTMQQRPIVTQIVERSEVPVSFRAKGPDNRLIIVEGIGDFVLRNGKRIICLKMRRHDAKGLDGYTSYEDDSRYGKEWDVPPNLPNFLDSSSGSSSKDSLKGGSNGEEEHLSFNEYIQSQSTNKVINTDSQSSSNVITPSYKSNSRGSNAGSQGVSMRGYSSSFDDGGLNSSISVQLGTGDDIAQMESLWDSLSSKHPDVLNGYNPFFSVDAPADGVGKELFHLRVGPINNLSTGDSICSQLGRKGVFCSVVRTQ
ncbi:MAG: TrbG/VirB9 family P-type conjugative transfer protein [Alphaproteobacteria bacterium]